MGDLDSLDEGAKSAVLKYLCVVADNVDAVQNLPELGLPSPPPDRSMFDHVMEKVSNFPLIDIEGLRVNADAMAELLRESDASTMHSFVFRANIQTQRVWDFGRGGLLSLGIGAL